MTRGKPKKICKGCSTESDEALVYLTATSRRAALANEFGNNVPTSKCSDQQKDGNLWLSDFVLALRKMSHTPTWVPAHAVTHWHT